MAAPSWSKVSPVIQSLLDDAPQFDLYVALYYLETLWDANSSLEQGERKRIRVIPYESLAFPASDIKQCDLNLDKRRIELKVRFSGLFGVDSPLPQYFIEAAMGQKNDDSNDFNDESGERVREFLNIFNHHFYCLMYSAWKKYQPVLPGQGQQDYLNIRSALTSNRDLSSSALPLYGLTSHRVESAASVQVMLQYLVKDFTVSVDDQVEHWVESLGSGAIGSTDVGLGQGMTVGERMLVVGGKVHIHIGPMNSHECQSFLPGGHKASEIQDVLESYLKPSIDYELILLVKSESSPVQPLTGNGLQLGSTTWLGENPAMERRIKISRRQLKQQLPVNSSLVAKAA